MFIPNKTDLLKRISKSSSAFTLIELLVVISIIVILSIIGLVVFSGITKSANSSKDKANLDAIKQAYEKNYDPTANGGQGGYKPIQNSDFSSGQIPVMANGSPYPSYNPSPNADNSLPGYRVCNSDNSLCDAATQGSWINSPQSQFSACDSTNSLTSASGLIGYWKFDNNLNDSSGSGYTGTYVGGTPQYIAGVAGQALNFSSNVLNTGNTFNFSSSQSFSLSAWVKPSTNGGTGSSIYGVVDKGYGFLGTYGLDVRSTGTSKMLVFMGMENISSGSPQLWDTGGPNLYDGNWHLLTLTRDATVPTNRILKLYVDGVIATSANSGNPINYTDWTGGNFTSGQDVYIGSSPASSTNVFPGAIDDVRIYNTALSQTQINLLYSKCINP